MEQFLKSLNQEVVKINAIFANPKPLYMSEKNEKDFKSATGSARKNSTMKRIRKYGTTVISWAAIEVQPIKSAT